MIVVDNTHSSISVCGKRAMPLAKSNAVLLDMKLRFPRALQLRHAMWMRPEAKEPQSTQLPSNGKFGMTMLLGETIDLDDAHERGKARTDDARIER